MRQFLPTRTVLLFLVVPFAYSLVSLASQISHAEGISDTTIDRLIADLGSSRFEIRESASRALKERIDSISAVRKARQSVDLEIRRRAEEILRVLEQKQALRCLGKVKALGKAGRVVEVADRLAFTAKCGVAAEEGWDSLMQFAAQACVCLERAWPRGLGFGASNIPAGKFRRYAERFSPLTEIAGSKIDIDIGSNDPRLITQRQRTHRKLRQDSSLLLRGEEISYRGEEEGFGLVGEAAAASGKIQLISAACSLIVAGDDVLATAFLNKCILVCDGDLQVEGRGIGDCLLVVRGKIICKQGQLRNCLVCSGNTLRLPDGKMIDLKDGTPGPLAFVKFFELADVGIAAEDLPRREESNAEGVRFKEVRKESPFAAGLRTGDVITAIEEKKTPTTETFRRVLRRKLAEGGPLLTFTVRRAGKTIEVPIPVKD